MPQVPVLVGTGLAAQSPKRESFAGSGDGIDDAGDAERFCGEAPNCPILTERTTTDKAMRFFLIPHLGRAPSASMGGEVQGHLAEARGGVAGVTSSTIR